MFSKGLRFDPQRFTDVPGPNAHNVSQGSQHDAYKRTACLEKADRFQAEPPIQSGSDGQFTGTLSLQEREQYQLLQSKFEDLVKLRAEESRDHRLKAEQLKRELAQAQKSISECTEKQAKQTKNMDILEAKLRELKKASMVDQSENKDLKTKLRLSEHERSQSQAKLSELVDARKALHAMDDRRREENRERDKKIAELRKSLEQEQRRREAGDARLKDLQGKDDAVVRTLQQELSLLRGEQEQMKASFRTQFDQAQAREQALIIQLEHCRDMLQRVAEEYGRLFASTVPKPLFDRVKFDYDTHQIRTLRLTRKLANSDAQVAELARLVHSVKSENQLLALQLLEARESISYYRSIFSDASGASSTPEYDCSAQLVASIGWEFRENRKYSDVISNMDYSLALEHYSLTANQLLLSYALSEGEIRLRQQLCSRLEAHTSAILAEREGLENRLVDVHHKMHSTESELQVQTLAVAQAEARVKDVQKQLYETEQNLHDLASSHLEAVHKEREVTRRLTSSLHLAKNVEEGLRAEVQQLTTDLDDAERYQEAYCGLSEEVGNLLARNALAEDETERLRKFNAEILGHNNPAQRIMYVDRVRAELAKTKQKLTLALRERDAAASEKMALLEELSMYKSVVVHDHRPRTNLTRIVRQPLSGLPQNSADEDLCGDLSTQKVLAEHLPSADVTIEDFTIEDPSP